MRHTELLGSLEAAVDSASITRFSRVLNAVGGWVWWVGVLHPVARDGPTTIRSNWGRKLAKLALVLFLFFKSVRPLRRDLAFRISASRGSACARLISLRKQAVTTVVSRYPPPPSSRYFPTTLDLVCRTRKRRSYHRGPTDILGGPYHRSANVYVLLG